MHETSYGRVAVMTSPRVLDYAEYALPAPEPGAILMRVSRANVCGSELHIWNGKHPVKKSGGLGHEMVGTVAAIGKDRATDNAGQPLSVGDHIVATYFQTCDRCARCLGGQPNLCDNAYEFFGKQPGEAPHFHAAFGTHYYIHPRQHVYKVPDEIPDSVAASANCALSQVTFGIDQIGLQYGETLLIQGAGGLGLNAIAVAKERGAAVIVIDRSEPRLVQAQRFGADHIINMGEIPELDDRIEVIQGLTAGQGPDVAMEVTGAPAAFSEGLQQLRRGGRYVVMGNLSPGSTVPFDPGYVTRKALTIRHVDRYEGRYLHKSLKFLAEHQGKYPFGALVDATFTLDGVEEALEKSLAREVTRAAIVIDESS
ncbi:zinc-binding dehydrogenase [Arthrobacter sp. QXT-31]|uniref:zinc-binding dehydrogenase n=1 Tax=Arthrobacter sp. QXT-31 TaxID=1357915 RepID=UPI0009FB7E5C|nr:zinc-binding dehydrogenase [Arthrobacter sp. QXT-31]